MAHVFNHKKMAKLDNPQRRKTMPPEEILQISGLKKGQIMVDIGAGIGYFSIPASEIVGKTGMVYALDINKELLDELDKRTAENKIENIESVLIKSNNFLIENDFVDHVFLCNVYHELEDTIEFIKRVKEIMKDGACLTIVDWQKKSMEMGPPVDHRIDKLKVIQDLEKNNFFIIEEMDYKEMYYIIKAEKKG
jgi:ubiquinone/menaquinone biosynthesis C-methylase UbiE